MMANPRLQFQERKSRQRLEHRVEIRDRSCMMSRQRSDFDPDRMKGQE